MSFFGDTILQRLRIELFTYEGFLEARTTGKMRDE